MITRNAATLDFNQSEIIVRAPANFVTLEMNTAVDSIRIIAHYLAGFKNGKHFFSNEKAAILFS